MFKTITISLCLVLGIALNAFGQTRYVADELFVNLRSGQGDQYRIVKILRSGTSMSILETSDNNEWVKVQTEGGDEGWVRSQYLQAEPIARDRLIQAQERISELTTQQQRLQEQVATLEARNSELTEELETTKAQASQVQSELDELKRVSENAVTLNQTNKELMENQQLLQTEIDVLKAENERLSDDSNQTWFLYGAIAVAIGVILTLIIQSLRARRRYSDWA